jgi:hypothetical protein
MLADLNSTHLTFLKHRADNCRVELEGLIGYRLHQDDVIQFGTSNREYLVDIDRSEVEKWIIEEENHIKENMKDIGNGEFGEMNKGEIRDLLGMEGRCLLVEGLTQMDNYHSLKEYFGRYEKIKNIQIKIDGKTGKNKGVAVVHT